MAQNLHNTDDYRDHMRLGGPCPGFANRGFGWKAMKETIARLGHPSGNRNTAVGLPWSDRLAFTDRVVLPPDTELRCCGPDDLLLYLASASSNVSTPFPCPGARSLHYPVGSFVRTSRRVTMSKSVRRASQRYELPQRQCGIWAARSSCTVAGPPIRRRRAISSVV
jgi:hypothetical protein